MSTDVETPSIPDTLIRSWAERGVSSDGLDRAPLRTTLRADDVEPRSDAVDEALSVDHDVELGAVLGEGGMGVVHEARQRSLDRDVAVKRVRDLASLDDGARRLLREARVTGGLEHPNVVPIHLLGRDATGQPLIVMKRVEGRAWSELLAGRTREARLGEDELRRHLSIVVAVARAAHFAHTRGVLHRDIKPDNVMVGSFGEVYLVDWGLAVGLDRSVAGIPLASSVRRIEGTPVYMAPEMACADGAQLDARTDVYLLGASLHEIVTGDPPHLAPTVGAAVTHAFVSDVPADAVGVPRQLWQIVQRAMARDRAARFATAADLADAIESYLVRRGSHLLAEVASERAAKLERARSASEPALEAVRAAFHEARFAFEQSLAHWPENAAAREGLRAAITTMIELELRAGAPEVALALLPALDP
ncbi:MAG: serine/threonine protein kinase, partial [Deltaproteobacteria bacterium]|nr:serine/threonine protein kinase [Deltaproteobacteria bacterium]